MPRAGWAPFFGAVPVDGGARFRVWAPGARAVTVVVETGAAAGEHALAREPDDTFTAVVGGARPGDRYRLRRDGGPPMPDPASRFQPEGVHGPSEIVDPAAFEWHDTDWPGVAAGDLVLYELHVGTFTPEGTFAAAAARLPYLRDLGVTAIELMPVADFPGRRNWGYDPAALFAPARCYGPPDDLRRLVDTAHALGLAVHLDVVYNHLGPDGAYLAAFSPPFFTDRHRSPWGAGVNLDGPGSAMVRRFLIENALHWLHEYHIDGLRLDATHALADDGPRHFLAELASAVHAAARGRPALVIAEDSRNLAVLVREPDEGGWGLDGVWADDFHHVVRVMLAGDRDGYYADYEGTTAELAATLRDGWLYQGRMSRYLGAPRGSDPRGVPKRKFVIAIQNHDQVGNRAFGDRLHHAIDPAAYRAASALLLLAPETPLLFMGQEWAATTPFLYFTDHGPELGARVSAGRRREFARFAAFRDERARARIPDPQAESTFLASRLRWEEPERPPHGAVLRLYRRLLALRRELLP
ncbi:MAG TPA: malto-oligosyltrehalose trehalohydrolase, partial [Vicinamibacterales bacterium]|nr:malto-oligosyltrehalose trehalohydrolase [Vicinamibacterales bacterium]